MPAKSKKDIRMASILEAAKKEFEDKGYEQAKVSDIAKRVGIVEGTIFHYYGSKQGLVINVIEAFYRKITTELEHTLQPIDGTKARLFHIIKFHLTVFIESARLCSVIVTESRRGDRGALQKNLKDLNRNYTNLLIQTIKQGIVNGELKEDTSIFFIRNTVYGSMESAMWAFLKDNKEINIMDHATQLTELIYNGMQKQVDCDAINQKVVRSVISDLSKLLIK